MNKYIMVMKSAIEAGKTTENAERLSQLISIRRVVKAINLTTAYPKPNII